MSPRFIKTSWHLLCAVLAIREYKTCSTNERRFAVGAFGGWHLAAMYQDFKTSGENFENA